MAKITFTNDIPPKLYVTKCHFYMILFSSSVLEPAEKKKRKEEVVAMAAPPSQRIPPHKPS